ncbi:hypothetical protein [Streptomyces hawaiiensis]|nr:hypothetical protein [Streptomyces hawaiiensis]
MLTTPVPVPDLRPGSAAEPKWDGFRALVSVDAGRVVLRSRRGTEMGSSFPEVAAGAVQLPDATALDGELVVWDTAGRLAFERLQNRLARRGAGAAREAQEWPAHFVFSVKSYMLKDYGSPRLFDLRKQSGYSRIGPSLGHREHGGPPDAWAGTR